MSTPCCHSLHASRTETHTLGLCYVCYRLGSLHALGSEEGSNPISESQEEQRDGLDESAAAFSVVDADDVIAPEKDGEKDEPEWKRHRIEKLQKAIPPRPAYPLPYSFSLSVSPSLVSEPVSVSEGCEA